MSWKCRKTRFNGGSARIKHTPRHGIRHTGVMLVWACHYRGRDTRDLRDCRCNSCLYIMPPVLYGRTQTRELPWSGSWWEKRGLAGDESRELREKINPRRNYHVSRDGQIEPNVQAAKDSRCKRKLRLGDRRNFTPPKIITLGRLSRWLIFMVTYRNASRWGGSVLAVSPLRLNGFSWVYNCLRF